MQWSVLVISVLVTTASCQNSTGLSSYDWVVFGDGLEGGGAVTYKPTLPVASSSIVGPRTIVSHGIEMDTHKLYLTGTAANATESKSTSDTTPAVGPKLFVGVFSKGNTTQRLAWKEYASDEVFGASFSGGYLPEYTGRSALSGSRLFIAGTVSDSVGTDACVMAVDTSSLTVSWSKRVRNFARGGELARMKSVAADATRVCAVGEEAGASDPRDTRVFVVCLRPDNGAVIWFKQYHGKRHIDDPTGDNFSDITLRSDGSIVLVGGTWADHSGTNAREQSGNEDGVRVELSSTGDLKSAFHNSFSSVNMISSIISASNVDFSTGQMSTFSGNTAFLLASVPTGQLTSNYLKVQEPNSDAGVSVHTNGKALQKVNNRIFISGTTTSHIGEQNHGFVGPSEGVMIMADADTGAYLWFRYVGLSGRSTLNALACEEGVCYGAGSFQPSGSDSTFFMIMRTPTCGNGTHIPADINFPTTVYSHDTCYDCAAGSAQNISAQSYCDACVPGHFASSPGSATCMPCGTGNYSQSASSVTCKQCPLGWHAPSVGSTNCTECAAGSYSDILGASTCKNCAAGHASAVKGATIPGVCVACLVGSYAPSPGASVCSPCPMGSWGNVSAATTCHACPVGTQLNVTGGTNELQCLPCPLGTVAPNPGTGNCAPCAAGSHQNKTGQTHCIACEPTFQAPLTGMIECIPCPPGTASGVYGARQCALCPRGTHQNLPGQTKCKRCEVDTFAMYEGSLECTPCPKNSTTNDNVNADHLMMCKCEPGFYGSVSEGRPCVKCPAFATCSNSDRYPNVPPGLWMRTSELEKQYSCQPKSSCPGGTPEGMPDVDPSKPVFPPGAPQPNFTTLGVPFSFEGEFKLMNARSASENSMVNAFGTLATTTTSYTSTCQTGYTGEACSSCADNYYRSKGNCVECTGASFDGGSAVVWTLVTIAIILLAAALLAFGLWQGSFALFLEKNKERLQSLLSSKDEEETTEELASLSCHGVVRTTDASGDVVLKYDSEQAAKVDADDVEVGRGNGRREDDGEGDETAHSDKKGAVKKVLGGAVATVKTVKQWVFDAKDKVMSPFMLVVEERDALTVLELERRGWVSRLGSVISRLIKFAQFSSLLLNVKVEWPDSLTTLGSALQIASFDFNDIVSVQCLSESSPESAYASRYYTRVFVPILFMSFAALYAFAVYVVSVAVRCIDKRLHPMKKESKIHSGDNDDDGSWSVDGSQVAMVPSAGAEPSSGPFPRGSSMHPSAHKAQVLNPSRSGWLVDIHRSLNNSVDTFVMLFLLFGSLAYVTMHAVVIEAFTCVERDSGMFYLTAEPEIQCFVDGGLWIQLMPIAVIGFFCISLGVPITLACFIFSRHPMRERKVVQARYGFLWNAYREEKFWFELVNIGFKFVLVLMMPLSFISTDDQLVGMMFIFILYLMTQLVYLPFRVPSDNWMEALLLSSVLLLDLLGIILSANESGSETEMTTFGRESLAYISIFSMVFVMVYFLYTTLGGQARTQGLTLNLKRKFAGNTIRERYEFMASVCNMEQVVMSTNGKNEPVPVSELVEGGKDLILSRVAVMLPDNTFWLGDANMGRMMYIPPDYMSMWKDIVESGKAGRPDVIVFGDCGSGKSFFGAFLVMMFGYLFGKGLVDDKNGEEDEEDARAEEEGIADKQEGAEGEDSDDFYISTVYYETSSGSIVVFNLESMVVHVMSRKKFESRIAKGKRRKETGLCAMICDGRSSRRTLWPPHCAVQIHLVSPSSLRSEEWGVVGVREHEDAPLLMSLTPWDPTDLLNYTNLRQQSNDSMEFVRTLRTYLLLGGRPPSPNTSRLSDLKADIARKVENLGGVTALWDVVSQIELEVGAHDIPRTALVSAVMSKCDGLAVLDRRVVPGREHWEGAPISAVVASQEVLNLWVTHGRLDVRQSLRNVDRAARLDPSGWCTGLLRQLFAGFAVIEISGGCRLAYQSEEVGMLEIGPPSTLARTFRSRPKQNKGKAGPDVQHIDVKPMMRDPVVVENDGVFSTYDGVGNDDGMVPLTVHDNTLYHVFRRRDVAALASGAVSATNWALVDGILAFAVDIAEHQISIFKMANYTEGAGTPYARTTTDEQVKSILRDVLGQWTKIIVEHGNGASHMPSKSLTSRLWATLTRSPKKDRNFGNQSLAGVAAPKQLSMPSFSDISDSEQARSDNSSDREFKGPGDGLSALKYAFSPKRKKITSAASDLSTTSDRPVALPTVVMYHLLFSADDVAGMTNGEVMTGAKSCTISLRRRNEDIIVPIQHRIAGFADVL